MNELKLDLKDKKILSELEMNARIPHSELAKKVKLSKQVVKYRIEKLESEKIIQGYNALINVSGLNQVIYVIYLKLIQISSSEEEKWMLEVDSDPNVLAVGKNAGYWDVTLVIRAKNNRELDEIFKRIASKKQRNIKDKLITSEIESTYFSTNLIFKSKDKEISTTNTSEENKIDEKDVKIIGFLSENCRISLLDLSEKLNMSPNGVKDRIKKLEKNKVILGYKTKINYEKLGYLHFRVFLHLSKFTEQLYNNIKSFLKSKGNAESVSRYMGYADIDFRCYSKSIEEFYQLVSEVKDNFLQNIVEVDSMPIFRWEKISYYSR